MDTNVVTYLSLSIALLLYQLLLLLCWCPYIPFVGKLSCEGERRGQRTSYYQLTCRRVQDVSSAWKSPYAFSRNVICPYESLSASTRIVLTDFSQILATTGTIFAPSISPSLSRLSAARSYFAGCHTNVSFQVLKDRRKESN